jgi:hypothetical protein
MTDHPSYGRAHRPANSAPKAPWAEVRSEIRFPVDLGAVLQVEGDPTAICVVTILDVSKSGMRASCPVSIQAGARVEVTCCYATISGEVRYVREVSDDEFHVGIKVEPAAGVDLDLTDLFGCHHLQHVA